jgi:type II secretory pathway pseudopilin PulG
MKKLITHYSLLKSIEGQSLVEILVALGIAGLFIGAATSAVVVTLRKSLDIKNTQLANSFISDSSDGLRSLAESDWHKIYDLSKGSANQYFLVKSATSTASTTPVLGQESVLSDHIASGLVGHWKFDETSGNTAYDFSGNFNSGTLTGGPTRTASSSCKVGNCLSFDGNNDILTTTISGLSDGSISLWFYNRTFTAGDILLGKRNTGCFGYAIYTNTGQVLQVYALGPEATISPYQLNRWTHLVVTRSGTTMNYYVDGVLKLTDSLTLDMNNLANYIGGTCNDANYFDGYLDDVRIYNRALSADEISKLYNSAVFNRYFYVENANRDLCGGGSITSNATTSCVAGLGTTGVADDPSTQKITVTAGWDSGAKTISKVFDLTRYRNKLFTQTDWSGGSGQTGPITEPNNKFASSTNITYAASSSQTSASAGYNSPGTLANDNSTGTVAWSNPQNAAASDDSYATSTSSGSQLTYYLKATNFGFSLPSDSTISGIEAGVERKFSSSGSGNDSYTKSLLHLNGVNGDQGFPDSSASAHVATQYDNAQISTAQSKFGGASGYFDGSGDYLEVLSTSDFDMGTDLWTIDFWVKPSGVAGLWGLALDSSNKIYFWNGNGGLAIMGTNFYYHWIGGGPLSNAWHHIAITRYGTGQNNLYVLIDGVQTSGTWSDNLEGSEALPDVNKLIIGIDALSGGSGWLNGYIDEFRVSKGIARWTSNFTPPTSAYSADSYTKLLLHSDGLPDSAAGGTHIWNAYGNAQVSTAQSKFGGASGYFDGSGDYLSSADSDDWQLDAGNGSPFTIDGWFRWNSLANGYQQLTGQYIDGNNHWMLYLYTYGNKLEFYNYVGGSQSICFKIDWTPSTNTWYHIALVRIDNGNSASSWRIFINGVSQTLTLQAGAWNGTINNWAAPLTVGTLTTQYFNGWIDEFRISKGIARWTENFTPPTAAYSTAGSTQDNRVSIVKSNGTIGTANKASASAWPSSDATATYGGSSDLWSETWTYSDINNSNFGVAVSASSTNSTLSIDHIKLKVYYTTTTSTAGTAGSIMLQGF